MNLPHVTILPALSSRLDFSVLHAMRARRAARERCAAEKLALLRRLGQSAHLPSLPEARVEQSWNEQVFAKVLDYRTLWERHHGAGIAPCELRLRVRCSLPQPARRSWRQSPATHDIYREQALRSQRRDAWPTFARRSSTTAAGVRALAVRDRQEVPGLAHDQRVPRALWAALWSTL